MTRNFAAAGLTLIALLTLESPALLHSQGEPQRVALNQPIRGELTSRDPVLSEDGPFRLYRFEAQAGQAYDIQLRSEAFLPALSVALPVGGVTDYLARSSDHGLGAGALIRFEAPASATYLVLARTADEELGAYTLTISPAAGDDGQALVLGQPMNHWIESEGLHPLSAIAGVELEITARSRDFDTLLEVGRMVGGDFVPEQSDDDSGGDTDSRIYFTPGRTEDLLVRVAPYGDGDGGSYAIVVLEAPEIPEPRPLPMGTPAQGELREDETSLADGSPFMDWQLDAGQGDRFTIEVTSTAFDTNVAVGTMEFRQFVELASNDDSGDPDLGASDSRLHFSAPTDGPFIVRVTPYGGEGTGAYSISATELPPLPSTPLGGSIRAGEEIRSRLGSSDAILEDGAPYQEWRFAAVEGQGYRISLASDAFDTHLFVGRLEGAEFIPLAENDDWDGSDNGTDSRLIFEAPAAGEYVIRVRPFEAGAEGEYTLSVDENSVVASAGLTSGRISAGETVTGTLTDQDARLADGSPYELWYFQAPAARSYMVELSSSDFDAYLSVGRMIDGEYHGLAENDDYAAGTDSRIELTFAESGEYVIRANVLLAEERGAYTLRIFPAGTGSPQA